MATWTNSTNMTTTTFWSQLEGRGEKTRLSDFIAEIGFWNESLGDWDAIFGTQKAADVAAAFYPFAANSTLLCHTLRPGLATWGTRLRLITAAAAGNSESSF